MILHLQSVPPGNGLLWIRHGFKVFQRKAIALSLLLMTFMMAGFLTLLLPAVGAVLLLMAVPTLSLAFMLATHLVLQQQTPTVGVFAAPFKLTLERRKTQLMLGAVYALATVAIMSLSQWVDGGAFERLQSLLAQDSVDDKALEQALADPQLFWGAATRLGLAALLSVPFWHAPALVHWGGQGLMQALFSSTLGVWRNKQAFALNGLGWVGLMVGLGAVLSLLGQLLGMPQLAPLLLMPLGLLLTTVFYCSLYFTFVDCYMFGAPRDVLSEPPTLQDADADKR